MISLKAIHRRRTINLFFAEIIVALLFFSISGAVILRVFAGADAKSRFSARLEEVVICAQSMAEVYSETGDINTAARTVLGSPIIDTKNPDKTEIRTSDGKINLYASEESEQTGAGELKELLMVFTADGEELYRLSCTAYISANISTNISIGGGENE